MKMKYAVLTSVLSGFENVIFVTAATVSPEPGAEDKPRKRSVFQRKSSLFSDLRKKSVFSDACVQDSSITDDRNSNTNERRMSRTCSATNYLSHVASNHKSRTLTSVNVEKSVLDGEPDFPMHCMRIQDLLECEKLPSHDEVARMGKFVIADKNEKRPIVFVSHQWCSHSAPDPSNHQFTALKEALQLLMDGKTVYPDRTFAGHPGIPKASKFDKVLQNSLVWVDYFGVFQAGPAVDSSKEENKPNSNEQSSASADTRSPGDKMQASINSLPTYVSKSKVFFVLVPVVAHSDIKNSDVDYVSWRSRGWCRLEAVVRVLTSQEKFLTVIHSGTKMRLIPSDDFLYKRSSGCGNFSCCWLDHTVHTKDGPQKIPCDRTVISPVLNQFYNKSLAMFERAGKDKNDYSNYRLLLSLGHVVLRNLSDHEESRKLDSWDNFALAFRLDIDGPLKRSGGALDFSPLHWAVIANNAPVVKYLIKRKANVNERAIVKNSASFFSGLMPLHFNMAVGHGDAGKEIFDLLLYANCKRYGYAKQTHTLRLGWGEPLGSALMCENQEMALQYCSRVKPKFGLRNDHMGNSVDVIGVACNLYDVVCEYDRLGAKFNSTNWFGLDVLCVVIQMPKEHQFATDTEYEFHKSILQVDNQIRFYGEMRGGTHLHAAAYIGKPTFLLWLLDKDVDKNHKTKRGKTALDIAIEQGHSRCADILRGNQTVIKTYRLSSKRGSAREYPEPEEINDMENNNEPEITATSVAMID